MWNEYTDFAVAELAFAYGLHDYVKFGSNLRLQNREEVETMLEEYEYNLAFPVDFNSEVEYN